ncbi:MAG: MBL fold metallo-hydrolase [Rhodobacterales bacterium]|nr:MBL fold metallo-hydrolase [Rhodobacterales bacterium]
MEEVWPGILRVIAPNPSLMTERGTNTYLLGRDRVIVIDPGPLDETHLAALLRALAGRAVEQIIVTHSHLDHSGLAPSLSRATGAQVLAFGDSHAGRSAVMETLALQGLAGGGEGVDAAFTPDVTVAHGEVIETGAGLVRVIHTPGHFGNHLSLQWGDVVFSGDHVMGWATSLVSPPDGDLTDFMQSLARLREAGARILLPGHGAAVTDPEGRIDWLTAHRKAREAQILDALAEGPAGVERLTARVYADVPVALHVAAGRNVLAHLIDLAGRKRVEALPDLRHDAVYRLI